MRRGTSLARGVGQSARSALGALCERRISTRAFGEELRPRLRRLLDFDAYCLNTCDPASGVVTSSVGDGLSPEHARTLFAIEAEGQDLNGLCDLYRGPVRSGSLWLLTGGHPERSRRMREIFLPLGFGDELRAALVVADVCYGYLHLFRRSERAPFGAAEVDELGRVSPRVAGALRSAALRAARRAARSSAPSRCGPALILLAPDDRVLRQSLDAQAVLGARDALRVESGLPHVLRDVASRARRGQNARTTFVSEREQPLSVSAVQLGAQTAVVLDEPSAHATEALRLAAFALTPREREVSGLLARGHSNQNIAAALGIALYTVKDHVKAVLLKTGCATRTELAARLRGAD